MHEPLALVAVAGVLFLYAIASGRLSSTPLSGPIVFVGAGLLLGPAGTGLILPREDAGLVRGILELALVLVLFTDATSVSSAALRRQDVVPIRLLAIGLPLTMLLGWGVALGMLPSLALWEAALVGVILAPTDAALGLATISNPRVPQLVRQSINVESGLNDGMALPFFTLALAAAVESAEASAPSVLDVLVRSLVLSTALGCLVGYGAGRLLRLARGRGWAADVWGEIATVAVALGAYASAVAIEGSGFIAAWVAGLAFGTAFRRRGDVAAANLDAGFAEDLGALFVALSYVAFGAVLLGPVLEHLEPMPIVYGLLSLTLVRAVPVGLALWGTGLRRPTVEYVAWFGPRGLASVVFGLIALEEAIPGIQLVVDTVAVTVGLSVLLHGVTSVWGSERYGDWYERARATGHLVESGTAPDRPLRRRLPHALGG